MKTIGPGEWQLGSLYDDSNDIICRGVVVENNGTDIRVHVEWQNEEEAQARWFGHWKTLDEVDDPQGPPESMVFRNSHLSLSLGGCRTANYHRNIGGPGNATIVADMAIEGSQYTIEGQLINGLETEISGLADWLGRRSWEKIDTFGGAGRGSSISLETRDVPEEVLSVGDFSVKLLTTCESPGNGLEMSFKTRVFVRTECVEPKPFDEHMVVHDALRNLLMLSRWVPVETNAIRVQREKEPIRSVGGKPLAKAWLSVPIQGDPIDVPNVNKHPHIYRFEDLEMAGIESWLKLHSKYQRTIRPLVTSRSFKQVTPEALMLEAGIALEALGLSLFMDDGLSKSKANLKPLPSRVERVWAEVSDVIPERLVGWRERVAHIYNSIKHANRELPPEVDILNCWSMTVLVIRTWFGLKLGISAEELRQRIDGDRQNREWVSKLH
ncbi:MAG: hypothetical protein ACTH9H_11955 [Galactobacter sp.]